MVPGIVACILVALGIFTFGFWVSGLGPQVEISKDLLQSPGRGYDRAL